MARYCVTLSTDDDDGDVKDRFTTRPPADARFDELAAKGRFVRLVRWHAGAVAELRRSSAGALAEPVHQEPERPASAHGEAEAQEPSHIIVQPPAPIVALAHQVHEVVAKRFAGRARDIGWMTECMYSFEEWCNWEAWLACTENPLWDVYPKPQYSRHGLGGLKAGDWLVDDRTGGRVMIEMGLIHDGTGTKWSEKCDADRAKLERIAGTTAGLHLILVTSLHYDDVAKSDEWLTRWGRMKCWSVETPLAYAARLPERGQLLLKGWLVWEPKASMAPPPSEGSG